MDAPFLTCPICYERFNLTERLPRMMPCCYHSVCSACLKRLIQNENMPRGRCPLDNQTFPADLVCIDSFKINPALSQILEMPTQKELCRKHFEEITILCFTDQDLICSSCIFEDHQGHKAKSLEAIKKEINNQLKKVKEILRNLDTCFLEANKITSHIKSSLLKQVEGEFEKIRNLLDDKEQDATHQILSYFYRQEMMLNDLIGSTSSIRKMLNDHAFRLENIFQHPDHLLNYADVPQRLQEHILNCKEDCDFQAMQEESNMIKEKLNEAVQRCLNSQVQVISDMKLSFYDNGFEGLSKGIFNNVPPTSNMILENNSLIYRIQTSLIFDYDCNEDKLIISTQGQIKKDTILDFGKWKDAKNLSFKLTDSVSDLNEDELQAVTSVWRTLKANGILLLDLGPNSSPLKLLQSISKITSRFTAVHICLRKQNLSHRKSTGIVFELAKILSNCYNLAQIHFDLSNSQLNEQRLQHLLEIGLAQAEDLYVLSLNLSYTDVEDDDLCELALGFPKLSRLFLQFSDTGITSKTFEWIGRTLLKPSKFLELIRIELDDSDADDACMDNLFSEFGKVKALVLDLSRTKITDKTLESLSEAMLKFRDVLEIFQISFQSTCTTEAGLYQMIMPLPKINYLIFRPSITSITDSSLKSFANKVLTASKTLKNIDLDLGDTNVTDETINHVFKSIPVKELETLKICLLSTEVTDRSVGSFVFRIVPQMECLKIFELNVSDRLVSEYVKEKIKELESQYNSH